MLESIWNQNISVESLISNNRYISCTAGHYTIAISADGKVYPCELMMDVPELCIGDLKIDSFYNIWNNSALLMRITS